MLPLSLAEDTPDCRLAPPRGHPDRLPTFIMGAPSSSKLYVCEMHKSQMSDIWEAAFEKSVNTLKCAPRCLENGIISAVKALKKSHLPDIVVYLADFPGRINEMKDRR